MEIATIIMVIPILMTVGLILMVIRGFLTGDGANAGNVTKVVAAFLVLSIAIVLISNLSDTTVDHEDYDSDTNTLTIKANIVEADSYPWDGYASDVESLVINDGVTYIADGAFSDLTALEYISISESVESITSSAFGVTLKDYLDQTTEPSAGEYVGTGDGTLYLFDDSIFTYRDSNTAVAGLTTAASSAVNIVIPNTYQGTEITGIGYRAFYGNTTITRCLTLPASNLETTSNGTFSGCTGLSLVSLPEGFKTLGANSFYGCTSLETVTLPSTLTEIDGQAFFDSGITAIVIPEGVTTTGNSVFNGCTSLETVTLPSTLTSLGSTYFYRCTAIASVTFASGFAAELQSNTFYSWTFYDSDGTTELDKTVASNLAGYTFQGTASALIKVEP